MSGYGQFCPLAQASEVLAERWTPLVIRELVGGSTRFNDIQRGVPLMSSSLLSKRLRTLEDAGIVERATGEAGASEYLLTRAGRELGPLMDSMATWGEQWLRREIRVEDAEPRYLMWTVRGLVEPAAMPAERTTVHFRFPAVADKLRYWWLVLERPQADLCLSDPGFGVDLTVTSKPVTLASIVAGDLGLAAALRRRELKLEGPEQLVRGFRGWFGLSPFAAVKPRRRRDPAAARPR